MKGRDICLLLLCFTAVLVTAEVLELSNDNFDKYVYEKSPVLVKFHDPMCPHCMAMVEAYEQLERPLKNLVTVTAVNVMQNRKTAAKNDIKGMPTVILFENGVEKARYAGNRERDDMLYFVAKNLDFEPEILGNKDMASRFLESAKSAAAVMVDPSTEQKDALMKLQREVNAFMPFVARFAIAENANVLSDLHSGNLEQGSVVLFPPKDARKLDEPTVFNGLGKFNRVLTRVKRTSIPLFVELSSSYKAAFAELGVNVMVMFAPNNKVDKSYKDFLIKTATNARENHDIHFAICDRQKNKNFYHFMGIGEAEPKIGIYNFESKTKYPFPSVEKPFNEENLSEFISDVVNGRLVPHVKSEPRPPQRSAEHPVQKVVGATFHEFVSDNRYDRLLAIHIAGKKWQNELGMIEQVARDLYNETSFVAGEIEIPANDVPGDWNSNGQTKLWILPARTGGRLPLNANIETGTIYKLLSEHANSDVRALAESSLANLGARVVPADSSKQEL